ncbi:vWA domain-containing protein [Bowmanella yangjiangensis]|uniref:VWA domain-containing protein n=1 Tax=Bowmanella yangjiangensis TaxID=2811230 RepID=A0ABS3CP84_9ALTE|nr:VWA domain-containing protein [Bowmanella yangjiangensis]MBN7818276.1 VWA domain-containing protein [Bowmanella yangjiangensis]
MKTAPLFALFLSPLAFADDKPPLEAPTAIVIDVSNSMWGQVQGTAKIDSARSALQRMLEDWPQNRPLSLWAYGHRVKSSCDDIEQIASPGEPNSAALQDKINRLTPKGRTPLTAAVEQAASAMQGQGGTVILLTDGIESCERDPCTLAATLKAQGIEFTAHVVGFDIQKEADKAQLSCLASSTGGRYFDAGNEQALREALDKARQTDKLPEAPNIVLIGAQEVMATRLFSLSWQGQAQIEDKVVLVKQGATPSPGNVVVEAKTFGRDKVELLAPAEPGQYQAHYLFDSYNRRESLSHLDVVVTPLVATLTWQEPALAGSDLIVSSDIQTDAELSLVLVGRGQAMSQALSRASFTDGQGELRLANDSGEYDLLLVANWHANREEMLRQPLSIAPMQTTLTVQSIQGQTISIDWQGPGAEGDKIVLVAKGSQDSWGGALDGDFPSRSPLSLTAPSSGQYDVLYVSDYYGAQTELARVTVSLP